MHKGWTTYNISPLILGHTNNYYAKTMQSSCQLCTRSDASTVAVVAGGTAFDYDVNNALMNL